MDEKWERAKGYIQMEEMSRFINEVQQPRQKHNKREGGTKIESHKLDKHQPIQKGPRYERYTPLTTNRTSILEETFNADVHIKLPLPFPPRLG